MELSILLYLSLMILSGVLFGRLVKFIKLPNVTGYLIAGLLFGPYILNVFPSEAVNSLSIIPEMALGFIALSIGSEFKASYFKKVGFTPVVIAITEAFGAVLLVTFALYFITPEHDLASSLLLGAIAAATAPAATIMVIKQYKAKGPLTETLLSVVALDDAVALIAFGFAVAIAKTLNAPDAFTATAILTPLYEVGVSLVLGGILGFLFSVPLRWFKKESNRICIGVAFVFLAISLTDLVNGSALLTCMAMGAALINLSDYAVDVMRITDFATPPLYVLFFVLSGAELNLAVLPSIGLIGIVYLVFRVIGKISGAWFGAMIMNAPTVVKKYLGPTLIPQAGVAIGLSLIAVEVVPEYAPAIRAVVLCATLVYEIIGPAVSKAMLKKAGEIQV